MPSFPPQTLRLMHKLAPRAPRQEARYCAIAAPQTSDDCLANVAAHPSPRTPRIEELRRASAGPIHPDAGQGDGGEVQMIQCRIHYSHTSHKHSPRGHGIPYYLTSRKGDDCRDAPEVWSPPCGCVDVEGSRARFEPILNYRWCLSQRNLPRSLHHAIWKIPRSLHHAIGKYTVCQLQRATQRIMPQWQGRTQHRPRR